MNKHIQEAITVFNQGGVVIFPTDTAFGIGCRVDKPVAVKRVYEIRKRPVTQAVSLLVANGEMAKQYVTTIPAEVEESLIKPYWPGGLTIVLQSRIAVVPELVRGGGDTVGLRMPDHTELLHIITKVGVPILGPSANVHGEKTPFHISNLDSELVKKVDYVLGGDSKQNMASTVIDCTVKPWKIIRQGAVTIPESSLSFMLTLYIDSAKSDEVIVKLIDPMGEEVLVTKARAIRGSQVILSSIQTILEKKGKSLKDITAIEVYNGPGSYTGRRVGASIANALSYALHVPIQGKAKGEFVYPSYE